jgi:hypothetical protein
LSGANPGHLPPALGAKTAYSSIFVGRDQRFAALLNHRLRNLPRKFITPNAVQFLAQVACATFFGSGPRPLPPRRIIADVLPMPASKFGDPVTFNVDMVADDLSLHVKIMP